MAYTEYEVTAIEPTDEYLAETHDLVTRTIEPVDLAEFRKIIAGFKTLAALSIEDDRLLGLAMVNPHSDRARYGEAVLAYLAVEPGHQGHGIGSVLLAAAEQETLASGLTGMVLQPSQNGEPVEEFYDNHGYDADGAYMVKLLV